MSIYDESAGGKPAGPLGRRLLSQASRPPLHKTNTTEQGKKGHDHGNSNLNGIKGAVARRIAGARATPAKLSVAAAFRPGAKVGARPIVGREQNTFGPHK